MNDEELDRRLASVFHVPEKGSAALIDRMQGLRSNRGAKPVMRTFRVRRDIVGLAVTTALAFGIFVHPRVNSPVAAAASVRGALAKINTWHLKGWKMQDGRKVTWEVWGRRNPFFYREQVGEDIVLDDGKQRFSIYGPSRERSQHGGICVRLPSLQGAENVRWSYGKMVEQWNVAGKLWRQTAEGPVFNFASGNMDGLGVITDYLYFVDRRTWLPTRYEKRINGHGNSSPPRTDALLVADYDTPVPASDSAPLSPPGYLLYDTLAPAQGLPIEGVTSAKGFTLQCVPIAMDKDGDILVQMRGWLGSTTVPAGQGDVWFQADVAHWASLTAMDPPVNRDDKGRAYVGVRWLPLYNGNTDPQTYVALFVPREPLASGRVLPTKLTAKFDVSVLAGSGNRGVSLVREDISVSASLPKAGPSITEAVAPYGTPDGRPHSNNVICYGGYENLETAICRARAIHYRFSWDARTPVTLGARRSFYWTERAVASATSLDVQMDRAYLARIYKMQGDYAKARRILLDMLHEKRFLNLQALPPDRSPAGIKQAEDQLHKWNTGYFDQARSMLNELDKAKSISGRKR